MAKPMTIQIQPDTFAMLSKRAVESGANSIEELLRNMLQAEGAPVNSGSPTKPSAKNKSKPARKSYRCTNCGMSGHNIARCKNERLVVDDIYTHTDDEMKDLLQLRIESKYPGMVPRLGQFPDESIAIEYGVTRQAVHSIRNRLGVPHYALDVLVPDEILKLLGQMSDVALALKYKVSPSLVRRERLSRNIPAYDPMMEYNAKLEPYRHLIGEVSDAKLGEMAGVKARVVYAYRIREGIKTSVLSSRHADFVRADYDKITALFHEGKSDDEIGKLVGLAKGSVTGVRVKLRLLRRRRGAP